MFELLTFADSKGIKVEYWDFEWPLEAVYYSGKKPWILLSRELFRNLAHYRTVFAEELGHHFTGAGDHIVRANQSYQEVLETGRQEYRAMVWASRFLIPSDKLEAAVNRGLRERWELAEYFAVDESIIKFRIDLYYSETSDNDGFGIKTA